MIKWLALFFAGLLSLGGSARAASPSVAFFYGPNPPWGELQAFDLVVVDPGHVASPNVPGLTHTKLAAYVSLGEVHPTRSYMKDIPKDWLRGENRDWGSRLIDQSAEGWPRFFAETVVEPIWQAGYRTIFIDTLDSYQLFAKTPQERAAQEAGMVRVINEIKRRHPEVELMFNRGFEILDRVHTSVKAVAAESLFQGYASGSYRTVAQADREWLLGHLKKAREEYKLEVISIDYVTPEDRPLARQTAARIRELGFIPWVATPDLASLGIGSVEVMPRRVLLVHSVMPDEFGLRDAAVVRFATMPLNTLGYITEYADPRQLPETPMQGLYAGVVVWLSERGTTADQNRLAAWLGKLKGQGIPFALVDQLGVALDTSLGRTLGLATEATPPGLGGVTIEQQSPMFGFERPPRPEPNDFTAVTAKGGTPLLTLAKGKKKQVAAALMPWGGYVMSPYTVVTLPSGDENRWVMDPFAFFRAALRLPEMPVPDVTTESGRRMLLIHMDGDGFVSRSELPGNDYAGAVVRDRVVRKYKLPMTMSIIEAEIAPNGLYPKDSPAVEAIAKQIFAAPNVEIASHSYSHPFYWQKAEASSGADKDSEGASLNIPGYRFDLKREIEGSIRYIETRLAPAGKKVKLFLWTGDCEPGRDALEWTERLGVQNMNGGDTVATRSRPTLTQVEGLGLDKSGLYQVFAPNQNENVYTNNWTGPFYGFERVIETYELTEKPRRLKPINLYFHTYLTTKLAGMQSLDKVFDWILKQETTPVHASEYTRKVTEFRHVAVARTPTGWLIRGTANARTLRVPASMGLPDLDTSRAVAGYNRNGEDHYVHLSSDEAELRFAGAPAAGSPAAAASRQPRLVSANARIEKSARNAGTLSWEMAGHVPLQFTLANADACRVRAGGRDLKATRREGDLSFYQLTEHAARPLEAICRN